MENLQTNSVLNDNLYQQAYNLFPCKRKIYFADDPAHAWGKVPYKHLEKLGIENKITCYSYLRNDFAYLEVDCDFWFYVDAMLAKGYKVEIDYHLADKLSRIRNYEHYPSDFPYEKQIELKAEFEKIAKEKVNLAVTKGIFVIKNEKIFYADGKTEKDFEKLFV